MTSITIYTPFTYCLTFLPTGKRYYGVRYAKGCHPSQLWTTYFTSSETISDLIEEHGKDAFTFEVRKTFIDRDSANAWETKFLTRINAAKHPEWLNDHNGGKNFYTTPETVQKAKETKIRNGTTNSSSPESIQKRIETMKKNGTTYATTSESIQKAKDTKKERGIESPMKNPETVQKMLDTRERNGTMNTNTPESIQKRKDTMRRNGTTNTNTPESIQKRKDTIKERGIVNPFSVPFLSMIHNKKTYAKGNISKYFPVLKQYY